MRKPRTIREFLKSSTSKAVHARTISGGEKRGGHKPKAVTLPTLDTARTITKPKGRTNV